MSFHIKAKNIYNTLTVPSEESRMVPFASSIIKTIFVSLTPSTSIFLVKLVSCIAFGSASSDSSSLKVLCYLESEKMWVEVLQK